MAFLESRRDGDRLDLKLRGAWRAASIDEIRAEELALELTGVPRVRIDAGAADELDLAGAWALNSLFHHLREQRIDVAFAGAEPQVLHVVREALEESERPQALQPDISSNPIELLGRTTVERIEELRDGLEFIGKATVKQAAALSSWRRLRPISIARHVYDTGITAIPIVSLIAFLISVIIAYLSAQPAAQLRRRHLRRRPRSPSACCASWACC